MMRPGRPSFIYGVKETLKMLARVAWHALTGAFAFALLVVAAVGIGLMLGAIVTKVFDRGAP